MLLTTPGVCVVRLLPVAERARDLFAPPGRTPLQVGLGWIRRMARKARCSRNPGRRARAPGGSLSAAMPEPPVADAVVPDRVHTAMLFQAGGHSRAPCALTGPEREQYGTTSCAPPMLFPPAIRAAALKNACPTPCSQRRRGDARIHLSEGDEHDGYGTRVPHHDAA